MDGAMPRLSGRIDRQGWRWVPTRLGHAGTRTSRGRIARPGVVYLRTESRRHMGDHSRESLRIIQSRHSATLNGPTARRNPHSVCDEASARRLGASRTDQVSPVGRRRERTDRVVRIHPHHRSSFPRARVRCLTSLGSFVVTRPPPHRPHCVTAVSNLPLRHAHNFRERLPRMRMATRR